MRYRYSNIVVNLFCSVLPSTFRFFKLALPTRLNKEVGCMFKEREKVNILK